MKRINKFQLQVKLKKLENVLSKHLTNISEYNRKKVQYYVSLMIKKMLALEHNEVHEIDALLTKLIADQEIESIVNILKRVGFHGVEITDFLNAHMDVYTKSFSTTLLDGHFIRTQSGNIRPRTKDDPKDMPCLGEKESEHL